MLQFRHDSRLVCRYPGTDHYGCFGLALSCSGMGCLYCGSLGNGPDMGGPRPSFRSLSTVVSDENPTVVALRVVVGRVANGAGARLLLHGGDPKDPHQTIQRTLGQAKSQGSAKTPSWRYCGGLVLL